MECCVVPMALSKIPGLFEGNLTNRLSEQATEIANIVSHDCKFDEYDSEKCSIQNMSGIEYKIKNID